MRKEYFNVLRLAREDLERYVGKAADKTTDDEMEFIASKLGDSLMDSYWISLEAILDDLRDYADNERKRI